MYVEVGAAASGGDKRIMAKVSTAIPTQTARCVALVTETIPPPRSPYDRYG